jgi:hypothetical protein
MYRAIRKSLRNFRTRLRNNQDRHSRKDIPSASKVGEKFGVSLPLLTCSPPAWPPRLLYRRVLTSQRDLWITLYKTVHLPCRVAENSHITKSMAQRPSWETKSYLASHKLLAFLRSAQIQFRIHKTPPYVPFLSQTNPVHAFNLLL